MTTRNEQRARWADLGLSVEDLSMRDLSALRDCLQAAADRAPRAPGALRMDASWTIRTNIAGQCMADLKCSSDYFEGRQAMTFEYDGFVGFAGWADDENAAVFLDGFSTWLETRMAPRVAS